MALARLAGARNRRRIPLRRQLHGGLRLPTLEKSGSRCSTSMTWRLGRTSWAIAWTLEKRWPRFWRSNWLRTELTRLSMPRPCLRLWRSLHFTKKDRVDREFAVKLGKRLGVDALITGDVTLFGRDPKLRPMPSDEMRPRKIKARVTVEARLIEVATDMIVAVASGRSESKREGFNLLSGGSNWHGFGDANVDFGSREFQETILGEAVNDAVQQLATSLAADASQLGSSAKAITGLVVSASGAEIVLNIGAKAGLKVGDQMEVERIVRNIPDAANGELSRLSTTPIGIIRVDTVHDTYSVATKISGDAEIKVGDHVKGPAR